MTAKLRNIRPLSLLKFLAGGFGVFYLALGVLFGVLGMAGCNSVRWNQEAVTGLYALPMSLLICLMMWIGSTAFVWVALVVGSPLFRMFEEIHVEGDVAPQEPNQTPEPTAPSGRGSS